MKRIAAVFAVAAVLGLATPALAEDGKAVFGQKCAVCHGPDGKGESPMAKKLGAKDLTASKLSEAEMVTTIEAGVPPKMMAFKGKLTPEQVSAVAKYVAGGLK